MNHDLQPIDKNKCHEHHPSHGELTESFTTTTTSTTTTTVKSTRTGAIQIFQDYAFQLLLPLLIGLHHVVFQLYETFSFIFRTRSGRVTTHDASLKPEVIQGPKPLYLIPVVVTGDGDESEHPSLDVVTTTECDDDDDDDDDLTLTDGDSVDQHDDEYPTSAIREEERTKKICYSIDDFHRHTILGEGQFGQVWLVSEKVEATTSTGTTKESTIPTPPPPSQQQQQQQGNTTYAMKVLSKFDIITNDEVDLILREKSIMMQLSTTTLHRHPFIVQLHATFQNDNFLFLVQEFCQGGELYTLMHNNNDHNNNRGRLPEHQVVFYVACIADALEYMHDRNHRIVYRDLKPENIMFDTMGYPKLIDMGYAKILDDDTDYTTRTFCGTPNYISPEMIQPTTSDGGCSFPVDHWALGIVMHEMVFGTHPFNNRNNDMDQMELFERICDDPFTPIISDIDDEDDTICSAAILHLMTHLLMKDPTKRIGRTVLGGESICHHPLFSTITTDCNITNRLDQLRAKSIPAPWIPNATNPLDTSSFDQFVNGNDTVDDRFLQHYPKLRPREAALFDAF